MFKKYFSEEGSPRAQWLLATGLFLLWVGSLVGWATTHQAGDIRQELIRLEPVFLWINFIVLLFALWSTRALLWHIGQRYMTRKRACILAAISLLGWALVHDVSPRSHRLFYDEDIYEAIALNMAHNNKASWSNDGRWDFGNFHSLLDEPNKQPNAWPFVLSLAYRTFGVSEKVAFNSANLLLPVTAVLIFFIGALLFEQPLAGLCAALVYVMIPENLRWFSSVSSDAPSACFMAAAVLCTLLFLRERKRSLLFLATTVWAFAFQFRYENGIMAVLIFAMFFIDGWEEFTKPRLVQCVALLVILLFAHELHLLAVRGESWGSTGAKMSYSFIANNLKANTAYYFNGAQFPLLFMILALMGIAFSGAPQARVYVGLWFLLGWGVYLFFYAGSYGYGMDVRYAMSAMVPIALLAGRGLERLHSVCRRWLASTTLHFMGITALAWTLFLYLPAIRAVGQEAWQCRADHDAAEEFASLVPSDGIIMTHNPNMFNIWGKNAAQMWLFTRDAPYAANVLRPQFGDRIFLHWNYWCNTNDPVQVSFCQNVLNTYDTALVQEKIVQGQRFALYRVLSPKPKPSQQQPKPS